MSTEDSDLPGRPLSDAELAALLHLLSADFPGVADLRRQAGTARVVGQCRCGCATMCLSVDRSSTGPASDVRERVPVEAHSLDESLDGGCELLLFVKDGWLDVLEIAYYSATPPPVFPPPDAFRPPVVRR